MDSKCVYLDTYVLQQDMRIRLPKSILENMSAEKGITKFDIYLNSDEQELMLRIHPEQNGRSVIDDVK
mgnify:CR=1 FL=1